MGLLVEGDMFFWQTATMSMNCCQNRWTLGGAHRYPAVPMGPSLMLAWSVMPTVVGQWYLCTMSQVLLAFSTAGQEKNHHFCSRTIMSEHICCWEALGKPGF